MRQVDNVNLIFYLENVLKEISSYGIDVTNYEEKLNQPVSCYEKSKAQECERNISSDPFIENVSDLEFDLCMKLDCIEAELNHYILFLDLIHGTNDWEIDFDIDDLFFKIYFHSNQFLESFSRVDIQKLILVRYYDLLLKKVWKDYLGGECEYLEKYNDLKRYPFLQDSIKRFLEHDNVSISLDDITKYDLKTIFDKVCCSFNSSSVVMQMESDVEVNDEVVREHSLVPYENSFVIFWKTVFLDIKNFVHLFGKWELSSATEQKNPSVHLSFLKELMGRWDRLNRKHNVQRMYPDVDINWLGDVFDEVIQRVGIERVKAKNLAEQDLTGIDLSTVDFTDVYVMGANLSYTNAKIDPQRINDYNLRYCVLTGLDLSNADFTGIKLSYANLTDTGARIDPQGFRWKSFLMKTILYNCYVINNFDGYESHWMPKLDGAILINSFDEIEKLDRRNKSDDLDVSWLGEVASEVIGRVGIERVRTKDFYYCNLEGLDLSSVDFSGVILIQTNLKNTGARIDPQQCWKNEFGNFNMMESCLAGCYVINNFKGYPDLYMPNLERAILVNSFDKIKGRVNKEDSRVLKRKLLYSRRSHKDN